MRRLFKAERKADVAGRRAQADRCVASGWQLRHSCTDGRGRAVCPACSRPVRMRSRRQLRHLAWVVEEHYQLSA